MLLPWSNHGRPCWGVSLVPRLALVPIGAPIGCDALAHFIARPSTQPAVDSICAMPTSAWGLSFFPVSCGALLKQKWSQCPQEPGSDQSGSMCHPPSAHSKRDSLKPVLSISLTHSHSNLLAVTHCSASFPCLPTRSWGSLLAAKGFMVDSVEHLEAISAPLDFWLLGMTKAMPNSTFLILFGCRAPPLVRL